MTQRTDDPIKGAWAPGKAETTRREARVKPGTAPAELAPPPAPVRRGPTTGTWLALTALVLVVAAWIITSRDKPSAQTANGVERERPIASGPNVTPSATTSSSPSAPTPTPEANVAAVPTPAQPEANVAPTPTPKQPEANVAPTPTQPVANVAPVAKADEVLELGAVDVPRAEPTEPAAIAAPPAPTPVSQPVVAKAAKVAPTMPVVARPAAIAIAPTPTPSADPARRYDDVLPMSAKVAAEVPTPVTPTPPSTPIGVAPQVAPEVPAPVANGKAWYDDLPPMSGTRTEPARAGAKPPVVRDEGPATPAPAPVTPAPDVKATDGPKPAARNYDDVPPMSARTAPETAKERAARYDAVPPRAAAPTVVEAEAAAPAAPPLKARVRKQVVVQSSPSGADVYVDGLRVGRTPFAVDVGDQTRQVTIMLDGYMTTARTIKPKTRETAINVELRAR